MDTLQVCQEGADGPLPRVTARSHILLFSVVLLHLLGAATSLCSYEWMLVLFVERCFLTSSFSLLLLGVICMYERSLKSLYYITHTHTFWEKSEKLHLLCNLFTFQHFTLTCSVSSVPPIPPQPFSNYTPLSQCLANNNKMSKY